MSENSKKNVNHSFPEPMAMSSNCLFCLTYDILNSQSSITANVCHFFLINDLNDCCRLISCQSTDWLFDYNVSNNVKLDFYIQIIDCLIWFKALYIYIHWLIVHHSSSAFPCGFWMFFVLSVSPIRWLSVSLWEQFIRPLLCPLHTFNMTLIQFQRTEREH